MAWRAQPDTTAPPAGEVYAGVHAGPPTYPVQSAAPTATPQAQPEHKPARRSLRDRTHRYRHQAQPWRFFYLAPTALAAHATLDWIPFGEYAIPAVIIAIAVIIGGRHWTKQARREFRIYATTCASWAGAWMLYATEFGMWGSIGKYAPLLGLAGWLPLSFMWWERHRRRLTTDRRPQDVAQLEHPFVLDWQAKVEPETKWQISSPEKIAAGTRYRLQLVPGQTIEDAQEKRRKIASWLRINRNRITFEPMPGDEPGDSGDESVISMIVTKVQNPHSENQKWQGPTLDETTGVYKHGVYPDAAAFMRLFKVENGIPHRACNGLWSGATGSGKSRGLAVKIAEHVLSSMFVVWYADGKGGASASELDGNVDWYITTPDECERMLRAAWKVMKVRTKIVKQLNQARFEGKPVLYMGALGFPMLQIILDEAQEFLSSKIVAKLVKALLRMGNEVGIGMDLATQVPLLNELGGESGDGGAEVIRAMAKSGNLGVYRAEDNFTGTVTVNHDLKVDPKALPREPGWCYLAGHQIRGVACRSFYVTKDDLYERLLDAPVITLDEASARAAGEDYATRHQRAQEADVAPEEVDLEDLNAELAILLGERLPGQEEPGAVANSLNVKEAVFNAVKANGGPMKREEIVAAVAAQGKEASDSAINQALKFWTKSSHLTKAGHGIYDLTNREGQTELVDA